MNREQLKVWIEDVVRDTLYEECSKDEHLAVLRIGQERGDPHHKTLGIYVMSVLSGLAQYESDLESLPGRLEDMTEPQISEHISRQLRYVRGCETEDTIGSMLVIFQDNGITQYGATVDPETAPQALRELADRLERRDTVTR